MITLFDFATVACFLAMAGGYLLLTARSQQTLVHLLLSAIAFAVANQLGNAGYMLSGMLLIIAGVGYAFIIIRADRPE